jgi:hypothetical protein
VAREALKVEPDDWERYFSESLVGESFAGEKSPQRPNRCW